jgi:hypothetical protein
LPVAPLLVEGGEPYGLVLELLDEPYGDAAPVAPGTPPEGLPLVP